VHVLLHTARAPPLLTAHTCTLFLLLTSHLLTAHTCTLFLLLTSHLLTAHTRTLFLLRTPALLAAHAYHVPPSSSSLANCRGVILQELLDSGYLTQVHKFSKFIHGSATLFPDMVSTDTHTHTTQIRTHTHTHAHAHAHAHARARTRTRTRTRTRSQTHAYTHAVTHYPFTKVCLCVFP